MSAVLQFEVSTGGYSKNEALIRMLIDNTARDVLKNGGTFVLVVSDKAVTLIQHDDAKNIS